MKNNYYRIFNSDGHLINSDGEPMEAGEGQKTIFNKSELAEAIKIRNQNINEFKIYEYNSNNERLWEVL